jgi:hypothetical protein
MSSTITLVDPGGGPGPVPAPLSPGSSRTEHELRRERSSRRLQTYLASGPFIHSTLRTQIPLGAVCLALLDKVSPH